MAKEVRIRKSKSASDVRAGAVAWAKAIANDNSFHYGSNPPTCYSRGCYFCGTNGHKKGMQGYDKTYCCNTFVFSAYAHGGGDPHGPLSAGNDELYHRCRRLGRQ